MNNYYQNNGIIWVQGEIGAKAYQLIPNSSVMLLDSENDGIFYIKVSDNVGMCSLRTFKYKELINQPTTEYITRDEFTKAINELKGVLNESTISTAKSNRLIPEQSSKSAQEF